MSEGEEKTIEALKAEIAELRAALMELAVVQAEALNALARSSRPDPFKAFKSESNLLQADPGFQARSEVLDAAKRSLDVAARMLL